MSKMPSELTAMSVVEFTSRDTRIEAFQANSSTKPLDGPTAF